MMLADSKVFGLTVGSTTPLFLAVLAVHVPAALTAVGSGLTAALSLKGSSRHVRAGCIYYRALAIVFVTALVLAGMRPRQDWYLALIGAFAVGAALVGVRHRRLYRPGDTGHIIGMGGSFAAMLTAFYIDNGPHLPLWDRFPTLAFWLFPGTIGAVLIRQSVLRHRKSGAARASGDGAATS